MDAIRGCGVSEIGAIDSDMSLDVRSEGNVCVGDEKDVGELGFGGSEIGVINGGLGSDLRNGGVIEENLGLLGEKNCGFDPNCVGVDEKDGGELGCGGSEIGVIDGGLGSDLRNGGVIEENLGVLGEENCGFDPNCVGVDGNEKDGGELGCGGSEIGVIDGGLGSDLRNGGLIEENLGLLGEENRGFDPNCVGVGGDEDKGFVEKDVCLASEKDGGELGYDGREFEGGVALNLKQQHCVEDKGIFEGNICVGKDRDELGSGASEIGVVDGRLSLDLIGVGSLADEILGDLPMEVGGDGLESNNGQDSVEVREVMGSRTIDLGVIDSGLLVLISKENTLVGDDVFAEERHGSNVCIANEGGEGLVVGKGVNNDGLVLKLKDDLSVCGVDSVDKNSSAFSAEVKSPLGKVEGGQDADMVPVEEVPSQRENVVATSSSVSEELVQFQCEIPSSFVHGGAETDAPGEKIIGELKVSSTDQNSDVSVSEPMDDKKQLKLDEKLDAEADFGLVVDLDSYVELSRSDCLVENAGFGINTVGSYGNRNGVEKPKVIEKKEKRSAKKCEFSASDLVWGKVRSHPWWPGQIFDPSDSTDKAMKYFRKGSLLVAYFGDRTFAWNEASRLRPFQKHFSQMEKQSTTELFCDAVDCALEEVSRRVEYGLACSCLSEEVHADIKTQIVVNAGIRQESGRKEIKDQLYSMASFEPTRLVEVLKTIALSPYEEAHRLELVVTRAQLLSFYRWKGYSKLREFNMLGGLLGDEENILPVGPTTNGVEVTMNEVSVGKRVLMPIGEAKSISTGKGKPKVQEGSLRKRKNSSGNNGSPNKKERSLSVLMTENLHSPSNNYVSEGKAKRNVVSSSGKKHKAIGSVSDVLPVNKRMSVSSSRDVGKSMESRESFGIGKRIRKVARKLIGYALFSPHHDEESQEDDFSEYHDRGRQKEETRENEPSISCFGVKSRRGRKRKLAPTKESSPEEMLLQLSLVALEPLKLYGFVDSVVSFFSAFRNSVSLDQSALRKKQRLADSSGEISSNAENVETSWFDSIEDSYWTDSVIQSLPEEEASLPGNEKEFIGFQPEISSEKRLMDVVVQSIPEEKTSEPVNQNEIIELHSRSPSDKTMIDVSVQSIPEEKTSEPENQNEIIELHRETPSDKTMIDVFVQSIPEEKTSAPENQNEIVELHLETPSDKTPVDVFVQSIPEEKTSEPENQNKIIELHPETPSDKTTSDGIFETISKGETTPPENQNIVIESQSEAPSEMGPLTNVEPETSFDPSPNSDQISEAGTDKPMGEEENSPTALILNFSNLDSVPSKTNLNMIFSRYGSLRESETEVLKKSKRAKVVFKRLADAETAFSSAGKFSIFGPSLVSYRLKYLPYTPPKASATTPKKRRRRKDSILAEGNPSEV